MPGKLLDVAFVVAIAQPTLVVAQADCACTDGSGVRTGCVDQCPISCTGRFSGLVQYQAGLDCVWHIQCPTGVPTLAFADFETEENFDFVEVYDGDSLSSDLLAIGSGEHWSDGDMTASSPSMTVRFVSDYSVNGRGFDAEYCCADATSSACASRDCEGSWSCDSQCRRTWVETVPQRGSGAACPELTDAYPWLVNEPWLREWCTPGEGLCPQDCLGFWSSCDAACDRTWTEIAPQSGSGAACPTARSCFLGDGQCSSGSYYDPCPPPLSLTCLENTDRPSCEAATWNSRGNQTGSRCIAWDYIANAATTDAPAVAQCAGADLSGPDPDIACFEATFVSGHVDHGHYMYLIECVYESAANLCRWSDSGCVFFDPCTNSEDGVCDPLHWPSSTCEAGDWLDCGTPILCEPTDESRDVQGSSASLNRGESTNPCDVRDFFEDFFGGEDRDLVVATYRGRCPGIIASQAALKVQAACGSSDKCDLSHLLEHPSDSSELLRCESVFNTMNACVEQP